MVLKIIENYDEIDESDRILVSAKNILGWRINEKGKIQSPEIRLPQAVIERIQHFNRFYDEINVFYLQMFVLAYDEAEAKALFCTQFLEKSWLPVSEDFKAWRDEMNNSHQTEIAVALIYGGELEK